MLKSTFSFIVYTTAVLFYAVDITQLTQAAAIPAQGGRRPLTFIVPMKRRNNATMAVQKNATAIFNPTYAKAELQYLLVKYQHAAQVLHNVPAVLQPPDKLSMTPLSESSRDVSQADDIQLASQSTPECVLNATVQGAPIDVPPIVVTSGTATMGLTDMVSGGLDVLYYGPLQIGTPAQELTVDVDTGSADLWFPARCAACANKQFDPPASTSYIDTGRKFTVSYGSGEVSAELAQDVVSIQGLTVQKQAFGAVASESDDFNEYPNSGLLGLAFSSISASGEPTFFENLIREKQLAAPIFSVFLARGQETGSEVCFGCINPAKTLGPVTWVPVISKTYWSVALDSVSVNSTTAPSTNVVAAIDTGTTLIYLPDHLAERFYDIVPCARQAAEYGPEFFTYCCDSDFSVSLSFGGVAFSLNMADFNMGRTREGSSECVGGILSLGQGFPDNLAIIGDEFLKSWYATFDYGNGARVGFAPSVNNR